MWKRKIIPIYLALDRSRGSKEPNVTAPARFCHIAAALSNWSQEKVVCGHPLFPYAQNICLTRSVPRTTGADDADLLVLSKMPDCRLARSS